MIHQPVLLNECIESLAIKPNGSYCDATLGAAGHSIEICKKLSKDGFWTGIDQDPQLFESLKERLGEFPCKKQLVHANFKDLSKVLAQFQIDHLDGILCDLGFSSLQLESVPGLSWKKADQLLDMRLNPGAQSVTAADILNTSTPENLINIFQNYGELRASKLLVEKITIHRNQNKIQTVENFITLIQKSLSFIRNLKLESIYNQAFQALRIAVNHEMENLEQFLQTAPKYLAHGGRLAVISFHSLEDRLVKHAFRKWAELDHFNVITRKPLIPTDEECEFNPRARSAKLRILEKKL